MAPGDVAAAGGGNDPLGPVDLLELASSLSGLGAGVDDAELVDRIRALEVLKAAAAAAQACAAAALDVSQRAVQAAAGVPAAKRGQGVAAQVALARRESPHRGCRHLGLAKALVDEMPHTLQALQEGRISEWRATLLVRETAVLTRQDRTAVDAEVAGDPDRLRALEELGDRALVARAKQVAYRLDPRSVVDRAARAVNERCVTIRPAPDTMAYLTALLPARDAIAVHTALGRAADTTRRTGAPAGGRRGAVEGGGEVEVRGRGQLMADLLVARVLDPAAVDVDDRSDALGAEAADAAADAAAHVAAHVAAGVAADAAAHVAPGDAACAVSRAPRSRSRSRDVAVRLVMTDRALLDGDAEPAHLDGYGPVPAAWARDLVVKTLQDSGEAAGRVAGPPGRGSRVADPPARVFVTRLLTDRDGALVAMDSRARTAPAGLADLIRTRDAGTCRTPCCDAPVRHVDHVTPHADGGSTSAVDLQGLCEACNYSKQALGWRQQVLPADASGRHVVLTTTPTGHTYRSTAPSLPGSPGRSGAAAPPVPTEPPGAVAPPVSTEPPGAAAPPVLRDPPGAAAPPGRRPSAAPEAAPGLDVVVDLYVPSPVEGALAGWLVLVA